MHQIYENVHLVVPVRVDCDRVGRVLSFQCPQGEGQPVSSGGPD
jgi:hypothetical protein